MILTIMATDVFIKIATMIILLIVNVSLVGKTFFFFFCALRKLTWILIRIKGNNKKVRIRTRLRKKYPPTPAVQAVTP